jgi:hypothetical protein
VMRVFRLKSGFPIPPSRRAQLQAVLGVLGSGFRFQGLGSWVWGLGFGVWGFGVLGLGFWI